MLTRWKMPEHYAGEVWPEYFVFLGQHRESDALTRATLTRTSGGWWLTAASCVNAWAGFEALYLTPGQDAAAIAHLRKGYRCQ